MGHEFTPTRYAIVQFVVPRRAVEVVDNRAIERAAAVSGIEHSCIEVNAAAEDAEKVRLTCRVMMVVRLLAAWGDLLEGKSPLDVPTDEREQTLAALRLAQSAGIAIVRAEKRRIEGQ